MVIREESFDPQQQSRMPFEIKPQNLRDVKEGQVHTTARANYVSHNPHVYIVVRDSSSVVSKSVTVFPYGIRVSQASEKKTKTIS